eukprot:10168039-Alexandrium_andersonii.AAC.1
MKRRMPPKTNSKLLAAGSSCFKRCSPSVVHPKGAARDTGGRGSAELQVARNSAEFKRLWGLWG